MRSQDIQVLIVGGGVGGLSLARALSRVGIEPVVIERAETLDGPTGVLELWPDTLSLLNQLGVGERVRERGHAVNTWTLRQPDGTVRTHLEAEDSPGFVAIGYRQLREQLFKSLPDDTVRTGTAFRSFEMVNGTARVEFENGVREPFDIVVGADGVRSRTRESLDAGPPTFCGTTSLSFPLGSETVLDGAGEIWLADGTVFRAVPTDDQPRGWLTVPAGDSGGTVATPATVIDSAPEIGWVLPEALERIGIGDVWSFDDFSHRTDIWAEQRVALIGDAAHARHRLTGLGTTLAIEDAVVLASELTNTAGDLSERLDSYASQRRERLQQLFDDRKRRTPLVGVESALGDRRSPILDIRSARLDSCFRGTSPSPTTTTL